MQIIGDNDDDDDDDDVNVFTLSRLSETYPVVTKKRVKKQTLPVCKKKKQVPDTR